MNKITKIEKPGYTYIAVASDIHYDAKEGGMLENNLINALESYNKMSRIDGFLFAGDMVNNGFDHEWEGFMKIMHEHMQPQTKLVTCMGNHEWYRHGWGVDIRRNPGFTEFYHDVYTKYTSNPIEMDEKVNGIHLIAVSPDDEQDTIIEREPFLMEHIAAAAEEDPNKPIFVATHKAIKNTVIWSCHPRTKNGDFLSQAYSRKFLEFLKNYPQVIYVSGHTHVSLKQPRSIYQKDYTNIQLGSLGYNPCSGLLFEISPENKVTAYRLNFSEGYYYDHPWEIDIPLAVKDKKQAFKYTDARKYGEAMPVFNGGFEVLELSPEKAIIKFPSATLEDRYDDGFIEDYVYSLRDLDRDIQVVLKDHDPEDFEYDLECDISRIDIDFPDARPLQPAELENLVPGTRYRLDVRAVTPFRMFSDPIYYEFETPNK